MPGYIHLDEETLRDLIEVQQLQQWKVAAILGVSPDSAESHKKFIAKYKLPFDLLSDENKEVVEKYEVWKEKNNYGRKYMGVERTTYIIDEKGRIKKIFNRVKVEGHSAEIQEVLES